MNHRWLRLLAVGALVLAVACLKWATRRDQPINSIDLTLRLGADQPPRAEPLVVAGTANAAQFLFVHYEGDGTLRIGYDCWSRGGPMSAPFRADGAGLHRLTIDFPQPPEDPGSPVDVPLRVAWDGRRVLDERVAAFHYAPDHLTIGENRVGGTSCEAKFSGQMTAQAVGHRGSVLAGIETWAPGVGWAALALALTCLAAANWRSHRWFILAALPCVLAFSWMVTEGTFHFFYPESFGSFYDEQARSLLHGHWDVPYPSVGAEAFVFQGRSYGYFGPVPALLRMPFVLLGLEFGRWSRLLMTAEAFAALCGAYAFLRRLVRLLRGPTAEPSAAAVVCLTLNLGLGSTLFFLASRAYIYHEAILSGVAFALWSAYFTLRYSERPNLCRALPGLFLGLAALQCRPTAGLFALGFLGGAALLVPQPWPARLRVEALCLAAFLTFPGVSYLKFGTFEGMPQQYNPQFMSDPSRWARIAHGNFHLSNARFNALGYFLSPRLAWLPRFPYLEMEGNNPAHFPEAKYDLAEPLLAIPYAMPGLVLLAALGVASCRRDPTARRVVGAVMLGLAPVTLVLLAAVASSHRYTADFIPALACLGAVALAAGRGGKLGGAILAAATAVAVAGTFLMAMNYQGQVVWGVPEEGRQHCRQVARWFDRVL